jgi:predicted membrane-bound spermidine synthase
VEIKPLKSRAQVSRRKLESIPLLKNMRMDSDKVSIFKSAKNEYNLFMRAQHDRACFNDQVLVVNGDAKTHRRTVSDSARKFATTNIDLCRTSMSSGLRMSSKESYQTITPEWPHSLTISGQRKNISPSRAELRSFPVFEYQEFKI